MLRQATPVEIVRVPSNLLCPVGLLGPTPAPQLLRVKDSLDPHLDSDPTGQQAGSPYCSQD